MSPCRASHPSRIYLRIGEGERALACTLIKPKIAGVNITISVKDLSFTMFLSIEEVAFVAFQTIKHNQFAFACHAIVLKVTQISIVVLEKEDCSTVSLFVAVRTTVMLAVMAYECASSLHVLIVRARELVAISPEVFSFAVFLSHSKFALVSVTVFHIKRSSYHLIPTEFTFVYISVVIIVDSAPMLLAVY